MIGPIKTIGTLTLFTILFSGTLTLGGEMGNHPKEMMMDKGKEMGKHASEMMMDSRTGMLEGAKGHNAEGKISITHKEMGKTVLRITAATIDKVPDGRVYLAKNGNHQEGIELGKLKGFSGDLEFEIPDHVNTGDYNSVVVWCKRFGVEIGRASLKN